MLKKKKKKKKKIFNIIIRYKVLAIFQVHRTNFAASANQSNKSITCARVAGTELPTKQILPRMPTNQIGVLRSRHGSSRQTSFTAKGDQSNKSVTCARVARTEVCACHRGKNWFLTSWKLIFKTLEIDF